MSKLGSLYIRLGEPEGDMGGCCETADWAADEIERLRKENAQLKTELMDAAHIAFVAAAQMERRARGES